MHYIIRELEELNEGESKEMFRDVTSLNIIGLVSGRISGWISHLLQIPVEARLKNSGGHHSYHFADYPNWQIHGNTGALWF